jgi:hypothetical protein
LGGFIAVLFGFERFNCLMQLNFHDLEALLV